MAQPALGAELVSVIIMSPQVFRHNVQSGLGRIRFICYSYVLVCVCLAFRDFY